MIILDLLARAPLARDTSAVAFAAIATAACALFVALLVVCDYRGARVGERVSKLGASAAFIACGVALALSQAPGAFAGFVVAGLVFAAAGDAWLLGRGQRAFAFGLGHFLCAHLAYIAAAASVLPPTSWMTPLTAVPVISALAALTWLSPHLTSMRAPICLYVAAITTTAIAGLALVWSVPVPVLGTGGAILFAAGALCFFVSDLAVARNRFVAPGFVNRAWGRPTYYTGQLLIAWSTAFASAGPAA